MPQKQIRWGLAKQRACGPGCGRHQLLSKIGAFPIDTVTLGVAEIRVYTSVRCHQIGDVVVPPIKGKDEVEYRKRHISCIERILQRLFKTIRLGLNRIHQNGLHGLTLLIEARVNQISLPLPFWRRRNREGGRVDLGSGPKRGRVSRSNSDPSGVARARDALKNSFVDGRKRWHVWGAPFGKREEVLRR